MEPCILLHRHQNPLLLQHLWHFRILSEHQKHYYYYQANKSIRKRIRSSTLNNCFAIYQKDYKLPFPDKKQFFNHCLSFLAIEAENQGISWFASNKQKHPQLLHSPTPNNCSAVYQDLLILFLIQANPQPLLIAIEAWYLLIRLKTISSLP